MALPATLAVSQSTEYKTFQSPRPSCIAQGAILEFDLLCFAFRLGQGGKVLSWQALVSQNTRWTRPFSGCLQWPAVLAISIEICCLFYFMPSCILNVQASFSWS